MIKLKNLLKESFTTKYWGSRKFGDKLPTLGDYKKLKEGNLNEGNITTAEDLKANPEIWKNLKYDLQKQFFELEKIGPDYEIFVNAQGTAKILKQIKTLIHKLR